MTTTAREIQIARFTGVHLIGQLSNGEPQWEGTQEEVELFTKLMYPLDYAGRHIRNY